MRKIEICMVMVSILILMIGNMYTENNQSELYNDSNGIVDSSSDTIVDLINDTLVSEDIDDMYTTEDFSEDRQTSKKTPEFESVITIMVFLFIVLKRR